MFTKKEQSRQNNNSNNKTNNFKKSYTEKKAKHEPSGWAIFTQNVHLMKKKINLIIVEEQIVLKNCVKS